MQKLRGIADIFKKHFQNKFFKNVFTLLSGTAFGQLVPILISPILTRLYTPDEIGAYAIFFASSNILAIVASGRLEFAILIPKNKDEAWNIVTTSFFFLFSFLLIFICLFILFKEKITIFLGLSSIDEVIFLIPITAFFIGLFQVLSYWSNRNDNYKSISKGKIIQGTVLGLVQVTCSILNSLALILGRSVALLFANIYLLVSLKKTFSITRRQNIKKIVKGVLKEHKVYPIVTMPNALLNSVSNNLPNYMLESLYSLNVTGYYSWGVRLVQGPMGMVTGSIQQVFFRKASETYNKKGNLFALTSKMYKSLFFIGIIPYTLLFFFSPGLFEILFGINWRIAGEYTQYLTPWLFLMFMNSPINGLILILKKQKVYFIFEILLFLCRGGALLAGYFILGKAEHSVILYGLIGLIFNIFLLIWTLKISIDATK